ncbi:tRNA (N6-isopentenyl adenosine(37)-C2)-methylthiotransferase MiaB [bacterium]|nr:tRNA (N6-isopentenyl adenosine(37)-C2)-methylthiotransferase MiaB [bacterium]
MSKIANNNNNSFGRKFAPKTPVFVHLRTYGCQMNILDSEIITGMLVDLGYTIVDDETKADAVIFNTCSVRDLSERKVLGKIGSLNLKRKCRPEVVLGVCGCMAELSSDRLLKKNPHIDFACGTRQHGKIPELLSTAIINRTATAEITKHNAEHLERLEKAFCDSGNNIPRPLRGRPLQRGTIPHSSGTVSSVSSVQLSKDGISPNKQSARIAVGFQNNTLIDERVALRSKPWSAFVEIVRGCSNFCTYCVVPYARGPEISRQPEDIVNEINELAKNGCIEITLLGQNVNSYGKDLNNPEITLANLLREIQNIDGIKRLRFLTSNPQDISDDLISTIAECDKICHQIHFPLQSGSDRILKLMKRKYSLTEYMEKINKLRAAVPDISFSSDFIVGFPGETDEDFIATLEAMEKIRYTSAFLFKYSTRRGTKAADLEDDVPLELKKARHQELLSLQNQTTYEFHKSLVGKTIDVLIEGKSKRNIENAQGRSRQFFNVVVEDVDLHGGELVNVEITRATKLSIYGKLKD